MGYIVFETVENLNTVSRMYRFTLFAIVSDTHLHTIITVGVIEANFVSIRNFDLDKSIRIVNFLQLSTNKDEVLLK